MVWGLCRALMLARGPCSLCSKLLCGTLCFKRGSFSRGSRTAHLFWPAAPMRTLERMHTRMQAYTLTCGLRSLMHHMLPPQVPAELAAAQAKEYELAGPGHTAPALSPLPEPLAATSKGNGNGNGNGSTPEQYAAQQLLLKERHPIRPPVQHRCVPMGCRAHMGWHTRGVRGVWGGEGCVQGRRVCTEGVQGGRGCTKGVQGGRGCTKGGEREGGQESTLPVV